MRLLLALLLLPSMAWGGDLPNLSLTPGVSVPGMTVAKVCATKWGKDHRAVTQAMKRQVMQAYRMTPAKCPSGKIEIDHLLSRELSGADDVRNLWPQCYEKPVAGKTPSQVAEWGAHKKDRLENALHKEVCAKTITLDEARREIVTDWVSAYRKRFGEPK